MFYAGQSGSRRAGIRTCTLAVYEVARGWLIGTFTFVGKEPSAETVVLGDAGPVTGSCTAELAVRRAEARVVLRASDRAVRENSRVTLEFAPAGGRHISEELGRRGLT